MVTIISRPIRFFSKIEWENEVVIQSLDPCESKSSKFRSISIVSFYRDPFVVFK